MTDKEMFPNCQFFLTTHSNHFLDMTADFNNIAVYQFKKDESETGKFKVTNVQGLNEDILVQLGVLNSSVFLANCTIWVEGITDRIYIRKFLEIMLKDTPNIREDIHYAFVEYGGNNITHWSFLDDEEENNPNINVDRLCGKVFLIADSDKKKEPSNRTKKHERHEKLQAKLGERFYLLKGVEIENILSKIVIGKTVNTLCNPEPPFVIEKDDFIEKPLGAFIDKQLNGRAAKKFGAESGTIKDKVKFAKTAVTFISSREDLSEEAIELCQKIIAFIRKMNNVSR